MIPADVLIALFVLLFFIFAWLTLRWIADILVGRRATPRRDPEPSEPEAYGDTVDYLPDGDQGGFPPLYDMTPCKPRRAGDELPGFLKRTPGDQAALHSKYSKRAG